MRSRAARLLSTALACLALLAAGYFLYTTEQTIAERQAAVRAFDQYGRDAIRQLADIRSALQAYVSAGQSASFWMPKAAALTGEVGASVDGLRRTASSDEARKTLVDVSAAVTEIGDIDTHARDYLKGDQPLMAADVIFSEGIQTAAEAATGVETARLSERQALDMYERAERRLEAYALAGGAASVLLLMLGLALASPSASASEAVADAETPARGLSLTAPAPVQTAPVAAPPSSPAPVRTRSLETAAEMSRAFAQVQDLSGVQALAGRIASALDASGVIVWLGSAAGGDLRPVAAHGYSEKVLQLLPAVPATADNAAAAAYRSATLQIIQERPGVSIGALVAPIQSGEGCIGALAAEIRHGGESSADTQSLATIFASQLGAVLAGAQPAAGATRVAR